MRNISAWAIRSPIATIVLFIALTLSGFLAFAKLPVNVSPDTSFPVAVVTVTDPGTPTSDLEQSVTRRLEDAVAGIADVHHIRSSIVDGISTTTVEFQIGVNPDSAINDVRDAIARIRSNLPAGISEPVVSRLDVDGGAILTYAVRSSGMSALDLSWFVDNTLSQELLAVPGVGRIMRLGGADREIRLALDPGRLQALGITAAEVDAQLRARNVDLPAGRGEIGAHEQAIRTLGGARSTAALAATSIALPGGRWARLDQLGTVRDGAAEQRQRARFDHDEVVAFAVYKAKGASEVSVADTVARRLDEITRAQPGMGISLVTSTVSYTRASYEAAMHTLVEGLGLASLVVFCFQRDWRTTLIAAIAMPLSLVPIFAALLWLGFTLNAITLLALTLIIGVLVDDAIVEIENIVRHIGLGARPYRAAIEAADEIGLAVVATTMTIVVVFVPVSLMSGVVGQYFKQFGITVAIAVLASLLVARLLTPMLAAYFLTPRCGGHGESRLIGRYRTLLGWALGHRPVVLAAGALFFLGSLALVPLLPTGFLPVEDLGQSFLSIELPPGATIDETDRTAERVADLLRSRPEVAHVFTAIGASGPLSGGEIRRATLTIALKPANQRAHSKAEFEYLVRPLLAKIPDIRWHFTNGSGDRDVTVVLTSADATSLAHMARELAAQMGRLGGIANVETTIPLAEPEILIRPRSVLAASLGVSAKDIAETARIATIGNTDANLATLDLHDRQLPIRVALAAERHGGLATIEALKVPSVHGRVPLSLVAEVGFGDGEARTERLDRRRMVAVEADLDPHVTLGTAMQAIHALPVLRELDAAGVREQPYGASEYMADMFSQFGMAITAGILMLVGVLLLLFKDFLQPITILTTLPLSVGGALAALLVTGQALDLSSFIGLLMLMGVVTKNSILLVDAAIEGERSGLRGNVALIQAGAQRARPIVMTTIAMIAGMLPTTLGIGSGASFRTPMATAVIGGLLTSTLLSLVFVPVFYSYMADLDRWLRPRLGRLTTVGPGDRLAQNDAPAKTRA
jgi:hydrophobic/amphiphilic exporter-1 (mainly G- bacteria), HAE1 family